MLGCQLTEASDYTAHRPENQSYNATYLVALHHNAE
jgi:hypothetical protein